MSELLILQQKIADESARSDIECFLDGADHSGRYYGRWYNLEGCEPQYQEWVDDAVRYLDLRGLLKRQPGNTQLIRPLSPK